MILVVGVYSYGSLLLHGILRRVDNGPWRLVADAKAISFCSTPFLFGREADYSVLHCDAGTRSDGLSDRLNVAFLSCLWPDNDNAIQVV